MPSLFRFHLLFLFFATSALVNAQKGKDLGCGGVQIVNTATGCTGTPWYYSKTKPRINAKTKVPVKILQGRAGGASSCEMVLPAAFVVQSMFQANVCDKIGLSPARDSDKIEASLKKLLTATANKQSLQKARLVAIKDALFKGDLVAARKHGELDRLAVMDYILRNKPAATNIAKQVDAAVQSAVKMNGGVSAALSKLYTKIAAEQKILQAQVMQKVKRLQQQAKAAQTNAANCGKAPAPKPKRAISDTGRPRFLRRYLVPGHPTSLEWLAERAPVPRTPTAGPRAPPAPSCPKKNAPPKKTVPVSKAATKAPPAKQPRAPKRQPKTRAPSAQKKRVQRPASRARRQPGKAATPRRTTPKRKPRTVPKPTRRPKGTPRRRRGRR